MNILRINRLFLVPFLAVALLLPLSPDSHASGLSGAHHLDNGLEIVIFTPELILENMTERDREGRLIMRLSSGQGYRLVEDIEDPVITHKGDGSFHPMKTEMVIRALSEINLHIAKMEIPLEIYILPYPRYCPLSSSTVGNRIFLSPGVYEHSRYSVSYIVTHEFGHTFHFMYLPDVDADGWYRYLNLRGIYGNPNYSTTAPHMNRPHEIFAEDFRYLFGGNDSRHSGTIENPNLPLPDQVDGLEGFMVSLSADESIAKARHLVPSGREIISASCYPNPFNPVTTIRAEFGGSHSLRARHVAVRIYASDGSLVRTLYDGNVAGGDFHVVWDGKSDEGVNVASGIYLYRLQSERGVASGKLVLVR
jgi:hypothetical protein